MNDPALRKICSRSGERCDCPKGVCNKALKELGGHMVLSPQRELKLYHEQSHEHDARQAAKMALPCKGCQSYGFAKSKLGPDRCEFCDGTFSGNPPTEEEIIQAALEHASMKTYSDEAHAERIANENEQDRIDRQEAGSFKYAYCAQILMLSSGKFALFGAYSMQDGIPLLVIDTWERLEPHVRAYRQTAEDGHAQETQEEEQRRGVRAAKAAADYDSLFGEET